MIALGFGGGFANWTSKVLQDIPLASDEGERGKLLLRLRDGGAPLPRGRF